MVFTLINKDGFEPNYNDLKLTGWNYNYACTNLINTCIKFMFSWWPHTHRAILMILSDKDIEHLWLTALVIFLPRELSPQPHKSTMSSCLPVFTQSLPLSSLPSKLVCTFRAQTKWYVTYEALHENLPLHFSPLPRWFFFYLDETAISFCLSSNGAHHGISNCL